ncbi:MAG: acyltransferase, partial [Sphingomonadales bacterium]|nr:acyltransferase [Sphingomonadales bacterium]
MRIISKMLTELALRRNRGVWLWRKLCRPSPALWTEYMKRHGRFHSFGENCFLLPSNTFTDPQYTSIGNNVWIVGAWVCGHDGSAVMLGRAYGCALDAVGPVRIHDDVFIGRGATILPGVSIGPRAIVGAGAVVSRDVPPNTVVAGNPARVIRSLDEHVERIRAKTASYPWRDLIAQREGGFDPAIEPELKRQRIAYFFGEATPAPAPAAAEPDPVS